MSSISPSPSFVSSASTIPPDSIYGIAAVAKTDPDIVANLVIGAYRDETGAPYVLPVVDRVSQAVASDPSLIHEYQPIAGNATFARAAADLIFGTESPAKDTTVSIQSLSGTGALRVLAELIKKTAPEDTLVYLPSPTWGNHKKVLAAAGLKTASYRYYKAETCGLDAEGMLEDLAAAPAGAVVLLHMCAHNPSGVDPSLEQWAAVRDVVLANGLVPWFDAAYQGFASGDPDADAASLRMFVAAGMDMFVAQSFAKSMGLYGERVGAAHVVTSSADAAAAVMTQLQGIVRPMYSSPPRFYAAVATEILTNDELKAEWFAELKKMSSRITDMRQALYDALVAEGVPGDWTHILNQIGMFSYTGLAVEQAEALMAHHHVYLLKSGRISMSGLNTSNVVAVAKAIKAVVE